MADHIAGETVICSIKIQDEGGEPKNPATGVKITIINPTGDTVVDEADMSEDTVGEYHYDYNSPATANRGSYAVKYTAIDGTRITIAKTSFIIGD